MKLVKRLYERQKQWRFPNHTIVKCSACGDECKSRIRGRWFWGDFIAWNVFCWTAIWRVNPPLGLGFVFIIVLSPFWSVAMRRLYHAHWAWKHPSRCDGSGQLEPSPSVNR